MPLTPGTRLGGYEILQPLGRGGMGEVHRARHLKLRREVAIKVLPAEVAGDPWRLARFEREARTASALNHPSIVTIHDIAEHDGITFIAMELVEGRTLAQLIAEGPLPVELAVRLAAQVADGLAQAHAAGIVHRDIKPANLMVTREGTAKILDFGLAKPLPEAREEIAGSTLTTDTREGVVVGTPHYMSPEQCSGEKVDHRSDQFACGVVLYEMLAGKPPFDGPSFRAIMSAVLVGNAPPLRQLRADVPPALERLIGRCLEKDPAARFPSTADLAAELRRLLDRPAPIIRGLASRLRRPVTAASLGGLLLAFGAGGWLWQRDAGRRWAGGEALEEITRLTEQGALYQAWRTALRAERFRPDDPALARTFDRMTLPVPVNTVPAGAEIQVKDYSTPDAPWETIGVTPMVLRIPYSLMRWRISRAGFEPFEGAPFSSAALGALAAGLVLDSLGTRAAGMVRVPGGTLRPLAVARRIGELPGAQLDPYFLDRYEVTNRQYREFVAAGGYSNPRGWPSPIRDRGVELSWEEAVRRFVDPTGQPGPSTWEAGSFPAGQGEYPVGGISWYEAAAYCAFSGGSLPTIYHWFGALGQDQLSDILRFSNMDAAAKAPVGRFQGLGAYGTYDMAGNVKEWAWNAAGEGRYALGGAWNEPTYLFQHLIAQDPMTRKPNTGVRCARYIRPPPGGLTEPVTPQREYDRPPPLTDEAFALVRGMYAYDHTPLEARVERVNDSLPEYRRETVSFRTAYGNDRMEVHLLLPRDVAPPYQSVIWFPGDDVFLLRSSERFSSAYLFDFLPRGGRVVVYPVYKGMYERLEPPEFTPNALRDRVIRWSQDISRTIDYLATRPDFDPGKIGYYGFSAGAIYGASFLAMEPRIATGILLGGGLVPAPMRPEVHPATMAPRATAPTLMINGKDDFLLPFELSQAPLYRLLGAAPDRKRHARLEGGHIPSSRQEIIREVLRWCDQQLGPVTRARGADVSGLPP